VDWAAHPDDCRSTCNYSHPHVKSCEGIRSASKAFLDPLICSVIIAVPLSHYNTGVVPPQHSYCPATTV